MSAARLAFGLLLVGELIQLATVLVGGTFYPGYDHARQYISELGASGAVTGPAVSWWGFVPSGLLITAFCLVAAWMRRGKALAVVACLMLAWYGLSLSFAGIYPCAFECARTEVTFDAMMHDLVGGTGYLTGILGVVMVAWSSRTGDAVWLRPFGLGCAVVAAIGFAAVIADVELGGVFQRALEGSLAVFLIAFGWTLLRGASLTVRARPLEPA
ncbi:DUF998 domain-containing protein [Rhizobium sp. CRIBSB]|nr:DUF998 domain-containing protein [Rhizobium sp. CRIBSB]